MTGATSAVVSMTSSGGGSPMVASRSRVAAPACAFRNNAVATPAAPRIRTLRPYLMIAPPDLFDSAATRAGDVPSVAGCGAMSYLLESYTANLGYFKQKIAVLCGYADIGLANAEGFLQRSAAKGASDL